MNFQIARSAWEKKPTACPRCDSREFAVQGNYVRGFRKTILQDEVQDLQIQENVVEVIDLIDCPNCGELEVVDDDVLAMRKDFLELHLEIANLTGKLNQGPSRGPLKKPKTN